MIQQFPLPEIETAEIVLNVVALRKTFFTYFANLFALKLLIKKPGGHQYSDTSLTK